MTKTRFYPIILLVLIIGFQSCENQVRKRVSFAINAIAIDQVVVAQGNPVNITASFSIAGTTNEPKPSVVWESVVGSIESPHLISTIWTAPNNFLGDTKIKLNASFMGHSDVSERSIKVVKTPAAGYGSISGNLHDEGQNPLTGIIVTASTGETDTTDLQGYFYIDYLPQGNNGLEFSNIAFDWATELQQQISIFSGAHQHLGNVIFYSSEPAVINSYQQIPERQAILTINHKNFNLIQFHELYTANNNQGTDAQLVQTIEPGTTEITINNENENAFYALKSIPLHGNTSSYSEWKLINFLDAIDPDAAGSFFTYNNFFSATLNWQTTGFEFFYKGFRVAEMVNETLTWVSPLLATSSQSYQLNTEPGQSGDYVVLAISDNGQYNVNPGSEQRISLNVPVLEPPSNFRGSVNADLSIRLLWEPITNNDTWHSGYLLEKRVTTDTVTIDWEELLRIPNTFTGELIDQAADSGNVYQYRISSVAYPDFPGEAYYSAQDSILLSTK